MAHKLSIKYRNYNKYRNKDNIDKNIERLFKEMQINDERRRIKNKFRFREKIEASDIMKVLKILVEDNENLEIECLNLNRELEEQEKMNEMLYEKIKWLEYKLDFLIQRTEHTNEIKRRKELGVKGESRFRR